MAIAYRAGAVHNETNPTTSLTLTIPASVQTNDILYVCIQDTGVNADAGLAGFSDDDTGGNAWANIVLRADNGALEHDLNLYWKRATSGTASKTVTVTATGESTISGVLNAYSGCKTTGDPHESVTSESNASASEVHTGLTAVTPSANNAWVLFWVANGQNDNIPSSVTATAPAALTDRSFASSTAGSDGSASHHSAGQTTAAAVGDINWAQGNAANASAALILLEDAAKVLVAGGGSYAITGTNASLEFGREVVAGGGSYAITGTDASLELGREVVAGGGSYAISGTDASLEFGREIVAGGGSYAITGTDASLVTQQIIIVAGAGSYAITGTDASLEFGREVVAGAGSYAITGTDASLEFGREIAAGAGSYLISGTDATLTVSGVVVPPAVTPTVGGHFLPEYPKVKRKTPHRNEVRKAVNKALREARGEIERVEEATGVPIALPVTAEMRDRLTAMLGTDAPDYLTPLEAARHLIIELIAEQHRTDEEEAMFIIMALGA